MVENENLKQETEDMKEFLASYGLKWKGDK
jgi:hypothetical protein